MCANPLTGLLEYAQVVKPYRTKILEAGMTLRFRDDVRVQITERQLNLIEITHNLSCGSCELVEPQLGLGGFESEPFGEELTLLPSGDAAPTGNSFESSTWYTYTTEDTGFPVTSSTQPLFYQFGTSVGHESIPCDIAPLNTTRLDVRVIRMFGEAQSPIRVTLELPTRMQEVDRFRFKRFNIPTLLTTDGAAVPVNELNDLFKIRTSDSLYIALGQQSCTIPTNLGIVVGDELEFSVPGAKMLATVTGYSRLTGLLVFNVTSTTSNVGGAASGWELSGANLVFDQDMYAVRVTPSPTDSTSWFRSTYELYSYRHAKSQGYTDTYSKWLATISSPTRRLMSNQVGRLTASQSFDIGGWTAIRELRTELDQRLVLSIAAAPWRLKTGDVLHVDLTKAEFQTRLQWFLDLVNTGVEVESIDPVDDTGPNFPRYFLKFIGGDYVTTNDLPPDFFAAVFNNSSCGLPVCCSGFEEFIFEEVEFDACEDAIPLAPPIPPSELLGLAFCPTRTIDGAPLCDEPKADQTVLTVCRDGFEVYQFEQGALDGGVGDCVIPVGEVCEAFHPHGTSTPIRFPGFDTVEFETNPYEFYERPCDVKNVFGNTPKSCSSQNHYIRSRTAIPLRENSIVFLPMDPYEIALAQGFVGTQQAWLDSVGLAAMPTHVNTVVPGIPTFPDQGLIGIITSTVSVAAATTDPVDLANLVMPIEIDGVALTMVSNVLVKNQADPHENGIYHIDMTTYKLKRHPRYGIRLSDVVVHVDAGAVNGNSVWKPTVELPFVFDPTQSIVGSTIEYQRMDGFQQYPVTLMVAGIVQDLSWNWTSLGRLVYVTSDGTLVEGDPVTGAPPIGLQGYAIAGTIISPTEIDFHPNPTHYIAGFETLTVDTVGYYDGLDYSQYITKRAPRSAMYTHRGLNYIAPTSVASKIRQSLVIKDQTAGADDLVLAKYW